MAAATIGYKQPDGTFRVVYCHCDGSPEVTAQLLAEHYADQDKVEQLVEPGNMFMLTSDLAQVVRFVDRGFSAEVVAPTVVDRANQLLDEYKHKHFYLFADGEWSMHVRGEHLKYEWQTVSVADATA